MYVIATIKNWHINLFKSKKDDGLKDWFLITEKEKLTINRLKEINPRYVFFPHWNWVVPKEITDNFECVCFHSSDLPYGRGGSPIQNLIIRGFTETKISALRMVDELDAGPVYMKRNLSLSGKAQDIYEQMAIIVMDMMQEMAKTEPLPIPQTGNVVVFKRRKGQDNILPKNGDLLHLYNHIRMLDADSYPSSFIDYGDFKIEFHDSELKNEKLEANVVITRKN